MYMVRTSNNNTVKFIQITCIEFLCDFFSLLLMVEIDGNRMLKRVVEHAPVRGHEWGQRKWKERWRPLKAPARPAVTNGK
jgi:hypothetical protein